MAEFAKVFRTGGSQAVRLPKKFRVDGDEVQISKQGERIILEAPRHAWSRKFLDLAGSTEDFPYPDAPGPPDAGPDLD